MMNRISRVLAALMAMAILMTGIPFGFAEEGQMIELTPEQIAELTAAPEEIAEEPTPAPTEEVAAMPEAVPSEAPTEEPTVEPTMEASPVPTEEIAVEPTVETEATIAPVSTEEPTDEPTPEVSVEPTVESTAEATIEPGAEPAVEPTIEPTEELLPQNAQELAACFGFELWEIAEAFEMTEEELLALPAEEIAVLYARIQEMLGEVATMAASDFEIDENGVLKKYTGSAEDVVIPDGVTSIARSAFIGNTSIRSVVIPASVSMIADSSSVFAEGAFQNCSRLEKVEFKGSGLVTIGINTFRGCTDLEEIVLPPSLVNINNYAFADCRRLEKINLPEGLVWLGANAFDNCVSLESIKLPGTLSSTGNAIFAGSGLEEVTIPGSLKTIQKASFINCKDLRKVVIEDGVENIEDSSSVFAEGAFQNCEELRIVEIQGNSMNTIGINAFRNCSRLTSVSLPESLTGIGNCAFMGCGRLESINLPKGLAWIGADGFNGCSSLASISLPDMLVETGNGVFSDSGLTEITIPGSLKIIQNRSFINCKNLRKVVIEAGVEGIEDSSSVFAEGAFQNCTALETLEIRGGDFEHIGLNAFRGCSSLKSVTLPENLESIADHAFRGCSALESINLPDGLEWIGAYAFCDSASLRSISLPDGLDATGNGVFSGSGLTEITIPGSLETIQKESFINCKNLRKVVIEAGVEGIEDSSSVFAEGAFQNCIALETLIIEGDDFRTLGINAFRGCSNLKNISLNDGLEKIFSHAFDGCTALETLYLPESVEEFGNDTFRGCKNATLWVYPDSDSLVYCENNHTSQGFAYKIIGQEPMLAWKGDVQPLAFDKNGGSVYLEIASNRDWTATAPEWLEISPASGSGNGGITIAAQQNAGMAREGSIIISAPECQSLVLSVNQASGCEHKHLYLYSYDADGFTFYYPDDEVCVSVDAVSHSFTKYVSKQTIECGDCGAVVEEIAINGDLSFIRPHAFYEGGDGKGGCYYCHYKASKGCKHSSYSSEVREYEKIDDARHLYSGYTLAAGYYACNTCGCIGDGSSWDYSDWESIEGSEVSRIENHSFDNGVCACGYALPKIEFTSHADGDKVEGGKRLVIRWECDAYSSFAVNAKLLDGEPDPGSDNEAGTVLPFEQNGNSVSIDVPDAAGKYIKLHVQGMKNGSLTAIENQLYLRIIDKNQITLSGGDRITVGGSTTLKAVDLEGKSLSARNLSWATSDKTIAAVSRGKVTAKKAGTVTITATAKDGIYGTFEITVCPKASSVAIRYHGADAGKTIGIDLSETASIQLTAEVSPDTASQDVTWKSSNAKVAKVNAEGVITVLKAGKATITATAADGSRKYDTVQLQVGCMAKEIEITGAAELAAGERTTLKASISPAKATNKAVSWKSSDQRLATVSNKGVVKAAKKIASRQSVIITATAKDGSGVTAQHEIWICPAASSVQILVDGDAANKATVNLGASLQLDARVLPEDAVQAVIWKSSSKKIAKIDANGLVIPVKEGTVTITAETANGKKATCKVKVEKATEVEPVLDFQYSISNGECKILKYTGEGGDVIIPAVIEGARVSSIGSWAFYGCEKLTSVSIPAGVGSIGYFAFAYCLNLTEIHIPDSVSYIDEYAFLSCKKLTSIKIPASVTSITAHTFDGCLKLADVSLPEGLKSISESAFAYCTGITSITIPKSVDWIDGQAFYGRRSSLTIRGYTGSAAERFAKDNGVRFDPIDGAVETIFAVSHPDYEDILAEGRIPVFNGAAEMNWTVESSHSWSVRKTGDWFALDKESGSAGSENLKLSILSGAQTGELREGTITFVANGQSHTVTIVQQGAVLPAVQIQGYAHGAVHPLYLDQLEGDAYISWHAEGADHYQYKVILMDTKPQGTDNESEGAAVLAEGKNYDTGVNIPKNKLVADKFLKIAVAAYDASGKDSGWAWIGFEVKEKTDFKSEVQRINQLISSTYSSVRANDPETNDGKGYGGYGGEYYCGRFVGRQAVELGFIYQDSSGNNYTSIGYPDGNDWYKTLGSNRVIINTKDKEEYIQKKYAGSSCLHDLIEANSGKNVYNIILSYERWSDNNRTDYTSYGHVRYIYAIMKDPETDKYMVYFTDNMPSKNGVQEGGMVSTDLEDFTGEWIYKNRYVMIGAIHFAPVE